MKELQLQSKYIYYFPKLSSFSFVISFIFCSSVNHWSTFWHFKLVCIFWNFYKENHIFCVGLWKLVMILRNTCYYCMLTVCLFSLLSNVALYGYRCLLSFYPLWTFGCSGLLFFIIITYYNFVSLEFGWDKYYQHMLLPRLYSGYIFSVLRN